MPLYDMDGFPLTRESDIITDINGLLSRRPNLLNDVGGLPEPSSVPIELLALPKFEYNVEGNTVNSGTLGGSYFVPIGSTTYAGSPRRAGLSALTWTSGQYWSWTGGNATFLSQQVFTLDFFLYLTAWSSPGSYSGLSCRRGGYSDQCYTILVNGDSGGSLDWEWRADGTNGVGAPTHDIRVPRAFVPLNCWHHLRFSRDRYKYHSVFVNGVRRGRMYSLHPINNSATHTPNIFGAGALGGTPSGFFDVLRFWDNVGCTENFVPPQR